MTNCCPKISKPIQELDFSQPIVHHQSQPSFVTLFDSMLDSLKKLLELLVPI